MDSAISMLLTPSQAADIRSAVFDQPDPALQEIVELLAEVCGAHFAAISVLDQSHQYLDVVAGMPPTVTATQDSLCVRVMHEHRSIVSRDTRLDERFRTSPFVDGTLADLRFYASAPIYTATGEMIGRLCVFDTVSIELTTVQQRTLDALALSVSNIIEVRQRRAAEGLPPSGRGRLPRKAAELSHDLRAPLASIVASLEMLGDDYVGDSAQAAALIARAEGAARRIMRLTSTLLEDEQDRATRREAAVDLTDTMTEVLADLGHLIVKQGATVSVGPLPLVSGDPNELYSVLLNLVSNALKHTVPGRTPHVRVRARKSRDFWRILVVDNGPGIPPEQRGQVFDRFRRVEGGSAEGHGVGLSTVKRIVTGLGGEVGVHRTQGGGATVWFEIPIATPWARGVVPSTRTPATAQQRMEKATS